MEDNINGELDDSANINECSNYEVDSVISMEERCEHNSKKRTEDLTDSQELNTMNNKKRSLEDGEDDDGEWTEVVSARKRLDRKNSRSPTSASPLVANKPEKDIMDITMEVCVTSSSVLPKQIALAKFFKESNIKGILNVRYLNPYKIRIQFDNLTNADKFMSCENIRKLGWRCQKTLEVGVSYGIVKDIDIELSDDDVTASIKSDIQLISSKRLNKRNEEEESGWKKCDKVRLCFKGNQLPRYIYVHDLRIAVEPYIFPVTQCSNCWKYGHYGKQCPANKPTCPKCGRKHANCDIKIYKCVNCSLPHIALSKMCPVYLKEKRIRELMAEFNCSYKRALTLYVPPTPPTRVETRSVKETTSETNSKHEGLFDILPNEAEETVSTPHTISPETYAEVIQTKAVIHSEKLPKARQNSVRPRRKQGQNEAYVQDWEMSDSNSSERASKIEPEPKRNHRQKPKSGPFRELLNKFKDIIFMKNYSIQDKLLSIIQMSFDWAIAYIVDNISEWPLFKNLLHS